ncbi:GNAT family N-acetyltransferase [Nocardioides panacisoli]|uniref:GNAT family N-acetyltransferase n=1 Tax=Nocardioides panacisoli TaxID=627624 RepID=A0ABP7I8N1_9ACTN
MTATDLLLRRATADDAAAIADVHLTARAASPMPPGIHPPDDVRRFLGGRIAADEVWVAEIEGAVAGYARFTETWLDDLYVAPTAQRAGVGAALLDLVKSLRPSGFSLWVFEVNEPARAFYRAHGLVEREHTDGSENEEREPDLRMEWSPR